MNKILKFELDMSFAFERKTVGVEMWGYYGTCNQAEKWF